MVLAVQGDWESFLRVLVREELKVSKFWEVKENESQLILEVKDNLKSFFFVWELKEYRSNLFLEGLKLVIYFPRKYCNCLLQDMAGFELLWLVHGPQLLCSLFRHLSKLYKSLGAVELIQFYFYHHSLSRFSCLVYRMFIWLHAPYAMVASHTVFLFHGLL